MKKICWFKNLFTVVGLCLLTGLMTPLVGARGDGGDQASPSLAATWRLGSEIYLSGSTPATYEEHPAVAANWSHDEYLVVWHNNRPITKDIYARRVFDIGELQSWFSVANCSNCLYPAVAYNNMNDQYLVVWSEYNVTQWEIWGKIIPWNGPGANTAFQIASWTSMNLELPAVVWNS